MNRVRVAPAVERIGILIIFGVAVAARLLAARGMCYWEDDLGTINQARRWETLADLLRPNAADWHPPLTWVFARAWMAVTGLSGLPGEELAMRLPFCVAGALAAPLAWAIARRVGLATIAALGTGVAVAVAPLLLWVDRDIRGYALLTPLVLASHLFLLRTLAEKRHREGCTWAVLAALAMWTHYVAIPIGAAQGLVLLLRFRSARPFAWGALALVLYAPWLPALREHLTSLPLGSHQAEVQVNVPPIVLTSPAYALFGLVLGHATFPWRFEVVVPIGLACAALVVAAAVRARREGTWMPLVFGVVVPVVLAAASPLRMPRYHVAACPMLMIALAQGASEMWERKRWLGVGLAVVVGLGIARSDVNLGMGREYHFLYPLRPWDEIAKRVTAPVAWRGPGSDVADHYLGAAVPEDASWLGFLTHERGLWIGASAPESCYAARGAGSNVVFIDPDHDLVAVVRWINKASLDGFVKFLVESVRSA